MMEQPALRIYPSNALVAFLLVAAAVHQLPKADAAHLGALTYCDKENDIYCLNKSPCKPNWQDTPKLPCDCADGYVGVHCEFQCEEGDNSERCDYSITDAFDLCDLGCDNNGKCVLNTSADPSLGFDGIWASQDIDMHCQCPDGFTGALCEHEVEVCGNIDHVCLNGSKCKQEADGTYGCECSSSWTNELRFAGKFCQHHHTDLCTPSGLPEFSNEMALPAFCVNDGVCMDVVNEHQQVLPGCVCPPLYEGPHCEFLVSNIAGRGGIQGVSSARGKDGDGRNGLAALAVFIVATLAVLALFVGRRVGRGLKRKKEAPPAVNLQSFRDENFGPAMSPNGNTLFPAFSMDIIEGARARDAQLHDVEFS